MQSRCSPFLFVLFCALLTTSTRAITGTTAPEMCNVFPSVFILLFHKFLYHSFTILCFEGEEVDAGGK